VLIEQDEHWQLEGRRMFSTESMAAIAEMEDLPALLSAPARELQHQGPQVIEVAAPPQGAAASITAQGPVL
jgi:hypothetical protein